MPKNPRAGTTPGRAHRSNAGAKRQGPLKKSRLKSPRFNISLNSQSEATFAVRARRKASRREAERLNGGPFPEVIKEKSAPIRPGFTPSTKARTEPKVVIWDLPLTDLVRELKDLPRKAVSASW